MDRTTRQVLAIVFSIISVIITCNRCQKTQYHSAQNSIISPETATPQSWTPELEKQMRDVFYTQSIKFSTDTVERNKFADCCMEKMKLLFPLGISDLGNITDSVKVAVMKIGTDCSISISDTSNFWQPVVLEQFKLGMYAYNETRLMPVKMKKEYVDCIVYKVVAKYPKGLTKANKDSISKYIYKQRLKCLKLIENEYGMTKIHPLKTDTAATP